MCLHGLISGNSLLSCKSALHPKSINIFRGLDSGSRSRTLFNFNLWITDDEGEA